MESNFVDYIKVFCRSGGVRARPIYAEIHPQRRTDGVRKMEDM
jgi:hypothetical protein